MHTHRKGDWGRDICNGSKNVVLKVISFPFFSSSSAQLLLNPLALVATAHPSTSPTYRLMACWSAIKPLPAYSGESP